LGQSSKENLLDRSDKEKDKDETENSTNENLSHSSPSPSSSSKRDKFQGFSDTSKKKNRFSITGMGTIGKGSVRMRCHYFYCASTIYQFFSFFS
jgi:hypothetical protein